MKQAKWVDKQDNCELWVKAGECDKQISLKRYHCKFSCNQTDSVNQTGKKQQSWCHINMTSEENSFTNYVKMCISCVEIFKCLK